MDQQIRVLYLGHSYILHRSRMVPEEVAKDPRFDVTIAAPERLRGDYGWISLEPQHAATGVRLIGLPVHLAGWVHGMAYSPAALAALLAPQRFDFLDAWVEPYVFSAYQVAKRARRVNLPFSFATSQNLAKRYPPPFSWFEKYVVRSAASWTYQAQSVRDVQVGRGYPADRAFYQPFDVPLDLFHPLEPDGKKKLLEALGISPPVICYVGRLIEEKGLDVLMQALDAVSSSWSMLVLGDGPYRPKLETWARQQGYQQRIRIELIKHSEMPRYLGAADMLVAPSQTRRHWKEQFGRMVIEAFACGVPVIGSDSGEIPAVIGDAGIIVPETDAAAWTREIQRLLGDPMLRRDLAEKGRQRASMFSAASLAEAAKEKALWGCRSGDSK